MFVSKKEYDKLKEKVEHLERHVNDMAFFVDGLSKELNGLKKPKEPIYFK